ncbi:MAG: C39 family peptidase [Candidatus Yonathbacteria bacterium]|nr:C39 family peptidase [Candidatus Yonathbacteria bacterium]
MKKILAVPYYSQKIDVSDPHWKERACGILCLKMVLDFLGKKTPTSDEFIQTGVIASAYGEWGWTHTGLVSLAQSFGIVMKRKEFRSQDSVEAEKFLKEGVDELVLSIEKEKPVLISAIKKWVETKKFHMMALIGFEMDEGVLKGFYYHDPDAYTPHEGKDQFVPIETFKKHWRRMAIFVDL